MKRTLLSEPFCRIPWSVAFNTNLKMGARVTYLALQSYADNETGKAWPSLATLAGRIGRTVNQVRRYLDDLVKEKEVKVTKRAGRSNIYTLTRFSTPDTGGTPTTDETPTPITDGAGSFSETPTTDGRGPLPPVGAPPITYGRGPLPSVGGKLDPGNQIQEPEPENQREPSRPAAANAASICNPAEPTREPVVERSLRHFPCSLDNPQVRDNPVSLASNLQPPKTPDNLVDPDPLAKPATATAKPKFRNTSSSTPPIPAAPLPAQGTPTPMSIRRS